MFAARPRRGSGGARSCVAWGTPTEPLPARRCPSGAHRPSSLADILERVLDKGIVIAGDIQINLLDIELLTIKLRLLIASVDRAREMGINWWETDSSLSSEAKQLEQENQSLRERLERLEERVGLPVGDDDATQAAKARPPSGGGGSSSHCAGATRTPRRAARCARATGSTQIPEVLSAPGRSRAPVPRR